MRISFDELVSSWGLCRQGRVKEALDSAALVAADALASARDDILAEACCLQAWCCFQLGRFEAGISHADLSKRLFADSRDADGECQARAVYAWLLNEVGLGDAAAQHASDCVEFARREGVGKIALSWASNVLAVVCWSSKQLDIAQGQSEVAVALARSLDDPVLLRWWLINLAGIHVERGYLAQAAADAAGAEAAIRTGIAINAEAMCLSEREADAWTLKLGLCNAVEYFLALGAHEAAEEMLARSETVLTPGTRSLTHHLYNKGQLLAHTGRQQEAKALCQESLDLAIRHNDTDAQYHALIYLSEIHEGLGEYKEALEFHKRFHEVQSRLTEERVRLRVRLAEVHSRTEDLKLAADEAIQRADEATRRSLTDPLTGLGNRRAFDGGLAAFDHAGRHGAIAIIDLDHFKRINDQFGHMIGDQVLQVVGRMLPAVLAPGDVAARIGGEEFAVILHGVDIPAGLRICRRIVHRLRNAPWQDLAPTLKVTVSVGIAATAEASDVAGTLHLADKRLYVAKTNGRNQVVAADSIGRPMLLCVTG